MGLGGVSFTNESSTDFDLRGDYNGLKLQAQKSRSNYKVCNRLIYNDLLVEPNGVEPLTSTLPVLRSTN